MTHGRYPACPHCRAEMDVGQTLRAPYFFCAPCGHYGREEVSAEDEEAQECERRRVARLGMRLWRKTHGRAS